MKITIIGAGNMGGAIACGLVAGNGFAPQNITVIDHTGKNVSRLKDFDPNMNVVVGTYDSLSDADVVILAVKPWLIEEVVMEHKTLLENPNQMLVSVAAGITLAQLAGWTKLQKPVYRVMPNTAIALRESMTFVSSINATEEQDRVIIDVFSELGKVEYISEKLLPAATSLGSCGIAFAFRYVRAAMEGGVEMGLYPNQSRDIVIQTLRGAIDLLEANNSHPEAEIDKVTTAGGITIKGLNEMEHAGFTSAVIRGLKASNVK
ncbi:pyrroline-5-carboxylate reductase [Dysgonomonas sp. ZJ709]|uniref:pyrroline-5-carboxylate reductase n=1 Tax=Dysgonomonas sp. ZJ709 TaxID=2709797 RepID=UPI0013EC7B80|nr:pyrroline-5-carboxylate reductase [Dysgonomonas sp. ZJ709]